MKGLFNHLLGGGCFFGFSLGIIGWILSIFGARPPFLLTSRFIRFVVDVYFMAVFGFFFSRKIFMLSLFQDFNRSKLCLDIFLILIKRGQVRAASRIKINAIKIVKIINKRLRL